MNVTDDGKPYDFECSQCERPIPTGARSYEICFEIGHFAGTNEIEIDHSEWLAILCAKCSLEYDLTQLLIPTPDLYYGNEPIGNDECQKPGCISCGTRIGEGEQFHTVFILPPDSPSDGFEPTVEVVFCSSCARRVELRGAEPPTSKPGSPCCYECGKHVGFGPGLMVVDPANYTRLHALPIELRWDGKVHVCLQCFTAGMVSDSD